MAPDLLTPLENDGSMPLRDRRREAFARALFEGIDVHKAFEAAGFKRPRGNAHRMEREPEIQARVNFLRRKVDEDDVNMRAVRRQQLRQQLQLIAQTDRLEMFEEIEITKTIGRGRHEREIKLRRLQLKPLAALTPAQRALVEGLESDGLRPAMPGKLGALAQLAKLDGLDQPTKFSGELNDKRRDVAELTREELVAIVNTGANAGGAA